MAGVRTGLLALLAALTLTGGARAADWTCLQPAPDASPFSWKSAQAKLDPLLRTGQVMKVRETIRGMYLADVAALPNNEDLVAGSQAADRTNAARAHRIVSHYLNALLDGTTPHELAAGTAINGATFEVHPGRDLGSLVMFLGDNQVQFPCRNGTAPTSHAAYWRTLFYTADLLGHVHAAWSDVLRDATAQKVKLRLEQYENWLLRGLPMWPWEHALNHRYGEDGDNTPPPLKQWVLRPTAGFLGRSSKGAKPALAVELGTIWYLDRHYDSWWGVSLMQAGSAGQSAATGLLLRWNQYSFGVTWGRLSENGMETSGRLAQVFVNLDLKKLIDDRTSEASEAAIRAKLRDNLCKNVPQALKATCMDW